MKSFKYRKILTALVVLVAMGIPAPGIAMAEPEGGVLTLTLEQTTKRPKPAKKPGALRVEPQSHQLCNEDRFTTCVYFGIGAKNSDGEQAHYDFLLMGLSDPKSMEVTVGFVPLGGWTKIPGIVFDFELDFNNGDEIRTSLRDLLEDPIMQAYALGWPPQDGVMQSAVELRAMLWSTEDPDINAYKSGMLDWWKIRCDLMAMKETVGCVNPRAIPELTTMRMSDIPAVGDNIRRIISLGAPKLLTRIQNPTQESRNHREACKDVPHEDGMQCDEYPFRSTEEGGTYTGMNVPEYQNRKQGWYLMQFYTNERVIHGDNFYVDI